MDKRVRVDLLGPVHLVVDGEPVALPRVQVRRALALLIANQPNPTSQDALIEHLWGDRLPADPRSSLRVALSRLRSALGEARDALESHPGGFLLTADSDVADFNSLFDADRDSDESQADRYLQALGLWREDRLAGDIGDAPMLEAVTSRLILKREQATVRAIEVLGRLSRFDEVIALTAPELERDSTNESLAIAAARSLLALGRRTHALDVLNLARTSLRDRLGIDPGAEFVALEDQAIRESTELSGVAAAAKSPKDAGRVFVGRAQERAALTAAHGGIHTVVAEPGAGKSALLDRVCADLVGEGRPPLRSRATQTPSRPMEVLTNLVTEIARRDPAQERSAALQASLSRLAPELAGSDVAPPSSRESLLALTGEAIADAADRLDAALVLDDAQWLDRASAYVIHELAQTTDCTIITGTREIVPAHASFLHDVSDSNVHVYPLRPLTIDDIDAFVEQELPRHPREPTALRLWEQSGGNALFLTLLGDLIAEGSLGESHLPPNVLMSVQRRLGSLSPQAKRTLEVASVFRSSFPIDVLRVLQPNADSDIASAVDEGLVTKTGEVGRFEFAHALVADAAYQLLSEGSRLELHDEVGRLLEEWGAPAGEYAHHSGYAAAVDPNRAVSNHLRAAREFADAFAWNTVLAHAGDGLRYAKEYSVAVPAERAELLILSGKALRSKGDPAGDPLLLEGVALAQRHASTDVLVQGIATLGTHGRMGSPEGPIVLDVVEKLLATDLVPAHRAEVLAAGASLVSISPHQLRGNKMFKEALELSSSLEEPDVRVRVLLQAHLGLPHPYDFELRQQAAADLHALAGEDPDTQWEAAFLDFGAAMVMRNSNLAKKGLAKLEVLTPRIRIGTRDFGLGFCRAAWARYTDDLGEAERLLDETMTIGREMFSARWVDMTYAALITSIREAQGRMHELAPFADALMAEDPSWPTWHCIASIAAASSGDKARARSELDWLKQSNFECLSPDLSWPAMLSFLTEPVTLLADVEAATRLLELVEPLAGTNLWNGVCIHKPADEVIEAYRSVLP